MKPLLLMLALLLQGEISTIPRLKSMSKIIELRSTTERRMSYPNLLNLQSARTASGEYLLFMEANSRDKQLANFCPIRVIVDHRELTLPCSKYYPDTEIIGSGSPGHDRDLDGPAFESYSMLNWVVRSENVKSVLEAKSVVIKIRQSTFELSNYHLEKLKSVMRPKL